MREQLEHLAEASELPNVEVRIYPLDWDYPPLPTGAFSYMQFPQVHDVPLHDIVSVEHLEGPTISKTKRRPTSIGWHLSTW